MKHYMIIIEVNSKKTKLLSILFALKVHVIKDD